MKAILFDLDGTLLDTRETILRSMQHAYTSVLGKDTLPSEDELLSMVGIPLQTQMERISPEKSDELISTYLAHNKAIQDATIRGFAGTPEVLAALKERGLRLAVVTSKRHENAVYGLEREGLAGFFEFVLGADDTATHKPDPGPLLAAARRMGLAAHDCAYIGDSPYDMLAAGQAAMYAIGALWGMFSAGALVQAGAEVLLAHISELPELQRLRLGQEEGAGASGERTAETVAPAAPTTTATPTAP